MHGVRSILLCLLLSLLLFPACRTRQENGFCEGTVVAGGARARVTALRDGKDVLAVPVDAHDGSFRLALAPGVYSISASSPGSPFPLRLDDIVIKSGETTTLPPLSLTPSGTGTLTGAITPPLAGVVVTLFSEGKERAAVHTGPGGKYRFRELTAGPYLLQAEAPGHAADTARVLVNEDRINVQNAVLFPLAPIDGVDWTTGKIRATGVGAPPPHIENNSQRREMTKRAALVIAQRNLLLAVERIPIDGKRYVKTLMRDQRVATRVRGFLKGYVLVNERELDGGRIEVTLELPLTGPTGLSKYITE
jgi:hypothetical protein